MRVHPAQYGYDLAQIKLIQRTSILVANRHECHAFQIVDDVVFVVELLDEIMVVQITSLVSL